MWSTNESNYCCCIWVELTVSIVYNEKWFASNLLGQQKLGGRQGKCLKIRVGANENCNLYMWSMSCS